MFCGALPFFAAFLFCLPGLPHTFTVQRMNRSHLIWIRPGSYCEITISEELCITTVDRGRNGSMKLKL
jgi:hypothetical protein